MRPVTALHGSEEICMHEFSNQDWGTGIFEEYMEKTTGISVNYIIRYMNGIPKCYPVSTKPIVTPIYLTSDIF
jgi:hypothetical protein